MPKIHKVNSIPIEPFSPNDIYFVNTGSLVDIYIVDNTGNNLYKVITNDYDPMLVGPDHAVMGQENIYTITNYDSFTNYNITAELGNIVIEQDYNHCVIKYSPTITSGFGNITINGKAFAIPI